MQRPTPFLNLTDNVNYVLSGSLVFEEAPPCAVFLQVLSVGKCRKYKEIAYDNHP